MLVHSYLALAALLLVLLLLFTLFGSTAVKYVSIPVTTVDAWQDRLRESEATYQRVTALAEDLINSHGGPDVFQICAAAHPQTGWI